MSEQSLTILTIFAHPDDEIGVGSTLGRYSDAGMHTVLVCASRGEVATIFCDDCATRENLAEVRTRELECACAHIGIRELRWLDWPDGGIKDLPRLEAVEQIVKLIRGIRPQVIITHPEHGLYPHPDHLALWEITRIAFDAAGNQALYPEAGPAWAAARLFTRAIPQSIFERAPGLSEFRVELNGELLPFYGTPDEEIAVTMRVGEWVPRRMAAWSCHISQHNPKGFSSTMPDGIREEMAANEQFLLAAARIPLPEDVHDDLLAGLYLPDYETTDHTTDDDATDTQALAEYVAALRDQLAVCLALTELARRYITNLTEQKYAAPLRRAADQVQEITYQLARTLRIAGDPPGSVPASERVRARGAREERPERQVNFLRSRLEEVAAQCEAARQAASGDAQAEVWDSVAKLARSAASALAAVTA